MDRLDDEPISFASFVSDGNETASIRCKVLDKVPSNPKAYMNEIRHAIEIQFDHVPMKPTGTVTTSVDLDVPLLRTVTNTDSVGALIGVADLDHPQWGYWRPDGTPLPAIPGVWVQRFGGDPYPKVQGTRRIGFLFRSRPNSTDRVIAGDASGLDRCMGITFFHTPSGRYDLNGVYVDLSLNSIRIVAKVPKADAVVGRLKLNPIPSNKKSASVAQFFAHRLGKDRTGKEAPCFSFDRKLAPAKPGITRSLQCLRADKSTPRFINVSTDWNDNAIALWTDHSERIVAANLLEHGYDYFSYANVALFPKERR